MIGEIVALLMPLSFVISFLLLITYIVLRIFRADEILADKIEDFVCISFLVTIILIVIFNIMLFN